MLTDAEKEAIRTHYRIIANHLPAFRPRVAQREMLAVIANTFASISDTNNDRVVSCTGKNIAVVEGPTGVGKSLAYLLAGSIMAKSRDKKLVVASATVALQEQLIHRDLPFLIENSGLSLTFALAKGRGRYVCPYRLYLLTADTFEQGRLDLDPAWASWDKKPEAAELATLRGLADAFYHRQWNGERDSWHATIDDGLWSRVTNDRHGCLKTSCPNRAECPFFLARDVLENVDVVVANHDLLLADSAMGGGVILPDPAHSFFCIDEAHHLAKKAVSQFAAAHSAAHALFWLDKVAAIMARIEALQSKALPIHEVVEAAHAVIETLTEWLWIVQTEPALAATSEDMEPLWLIEDGKLPEHLMVPAANMAMATRMLYQRLSSVADGMALGRRDKTTNVTLTDKVTSEVGFLLSRAEQLMSVWDLFEHQPNEGALPVAKWVKRCTDGKGDYLFCASPVSAAENLTTTLWRRVAGALLTSATLRSLGVFDFFLEQTGLSGLPDVTTVALASPFNFTQQGELYLPELIHSPKNVQEHTREIVDWLPRLIHCGEAVGTLVLFASKKQMQEVAAQLPETLKDHLLVQGEMPKHRVLERHDQRLSAGEASIIFGLASFAEGLDLPGNRCVHVIIAKLPFAMPDDPVERTLSRWIEKQGGNPFTELMVPEVSIKLIQAVGRLIRTEQDYGRITVLDHRLTRCHYGKKLLAALPPFKRI